MGLSAPKGAPSPALQKPGIAARAAALNLMRAVLEKGRPLDDAWGSAVADLEVRDRALVRASVATALRRMGQIDDLIEAMLDKKLPQSAQAAQHILRLGIAELMFMGLAPHAAVDAAVTVAKARAPRFAKLVNAVLRRLGREGEAILAGQDAARLNCPDWLWRRWEAAYGEADARALAEAHLTEAPLDITVKSDAAAWAEKLEATVLPSGSLRRTAGGQVDGLAGFTEGAWWVQDAAAALPARLAGNVAGRHVIDLCAAPGGKTAQLASAGAEVIAVEKNAKRAPRLRQNLERLGLKAGVVVADAGTWTPPEPADVVLLDAPCSATGTLRRHPDIAHNKDAVDIATLARAQARLLDSGAGMVAPGGLLIYCTCSLEPEEGEAQVQPFLARNPEFRIEPIAAAEIGGLADAITADGNLRTRPDQGWDGFFAARFRKKAN